MYLTGFPRIAPALLASCCRIVGFRSTPDFACSSSSRRVWRTLTIDAHQLLLQLNISDEELAQRKVGWTPPAPRYTRGVQAKFAFNAASASKGAGLDNY